MSHPPSTASKLLAAACGGGDDNATGTGVEGTGDAILAGWGGRADPSVTFAQRTGATAFNNPGGHSTPLMDELYAASIATADPDERQTILRQAAREAAESVLELVLFFPQVPYITAEHVVDFTPYLSSKPEFRSVAVTAP